MSKKNDGFDDLNKFLKDMEKKVEKASGDVSFSVLFNDRFMKKNTDFNNIDDFFEKSPFEFENEEEFEKIDENELDKYVKENTKFNTWEEMMSEAGALYMAEQLKF
ncbi:hypothetical protein [Niallia circulans]|uniref:hypothetical protein n=1 Tax=Niallia circulans TaxID=1397 RepID=UPI0035194676